MEAQKRKTISATFSRPIAPRSEIQDSIKFVQPPPEHWEVLKTRMKLFPLFLFLIIGNKIYQIYTLSFLILWKRLLRFLAEYVHAFHQPDYNEASALADRANQTSETPDNEGDFIEVDIGDTVL
jgi:hypothetical protein